MEILSSVIKALGTHDQMKEMNEPPLHQRKKSEN